jgi:hypothetical protein
LLPVAGNEYLDDTRAAAQTPNFLLDEIGARVPKEPVRFRVHVQLAQDGDVTDDSTLRWPESRQLITFGEISLTAVAPNNAAEQQRIIFDPIPRRGHGGLCRPAVRSTGEHLSDVGQTAQRSRKTPGGLEIAQIHPSLQ